MMITLTRPDGKPEKFKPDSISSIRPAIDGVNPGANSVIRSDGQDFAVKETVDEIDAILEKAK